MALMEPELSLVNFQREYMYVSYALVSLSAFFFSIFPHSHLPSRPTVLISALPRTPSPGGMQGQNRFRKSQAFPATSHISEVTSSELASSVL